MMEWLVSLGQIALPVAATVATTLLLILANLLIKKLGLQNSQATNDIVSGLVENAVDFVEVFARQRLNNTQEAMSGGAKLRKATEVVQGEIKRLKLPQIAADAIKVRIEAYLEQTGAEPGQKKE